MAIHDLTGTSTYPLYKTNIQNGHGIIRFSGTSNPLTNSATFTFRHFFIVAKYNGATFSNNAGLVTAASTVPLLVGSNTNTYFQALPAVSGVTWRAFINGTEVSTTNIAAPMNSFSLIELRANASVTMAGISIGKDRTSGDKWNGDFAELFFSEEALLETNVREIWEYFTTKWSIN